MNYDLIQPLSNNFKRVHNQTFSPFFISCDSIINNEKKNRFRIVGQTNFMKISAGIKTLALESFSYYFKIDPSAGKYNE